MIERVKPLVAGIPIGRNHLLVSAYLALKLKDDLVFPGGLLSILLPLDELTSRKKSKEPLRPLAKHLLWGIPTNIAAGPLGFRAELDVNPKGDCICSHCE